MHIQKNIVKKMKKRLNINEEYLANYLGVTSNTLMDWMKVSHWEGKNKRLYRLNKAVHILRNLDFKTPEALKNALDNKRISINLKENSESISIIEYVLCEDLDLKYEQILNSI